jgi:bacterioferritin-associated ferredoxin
MIVCVCRGASDRDIRNAISGGANCLGRLQQCGIGGDCGSCEGILEQFIGEAADAGRISRCATCCQPQSALATA